MGRRDDGNEVLRAYAVFDSTRQLCRRRKPKYACFAYPSRYLQIPLAVGPTGMVPWNSEKQS